MSPKTRRSALNGAPTQLRNVGTSLSSETGKAVVFCVFVALVFAMGGGSRADVLSLVALRPLSFLAAAYALLVARPGDLRAAVVPLLFLSCLSVLMLIQLAPLPPSMWAALPDRQLYIQISRDAGLPLGSRPITFSPARTLNALFSLGVPFAAVLLTAVQGREFRKRIFTVLMIASGASALLAVCQLAGPERGPLYLYRITNNGFPVGLLANRNHQAVLMVLLLVMMGGYYTHARRVRSIGLFPTIGLAFSALVVLALILVSGSRAGMALAIVAGAIVGWMLVRKSDPASDGSTARLSSRAWLILGGGIIALVGAMVSLSRASSIERLWSDDALNDARFESLSILQRMMAEHWLFGIGYGAFEGAFKRYETIDLLTPFVLNQAHDDWLQFPLEGGVLGALLLLAAVVWVLMQALKMIRRSVARVDGPSYIAMAIVVIIALASFVDYPLRTPIFMLVGAVSVTVLASRNAGVAEGRQS